MQLNYRNPFALMMIVSLAMACPVARADQKPDKAKPTPKCVAKRVTKAALPEGKKTAKTADDAVYLHFEVVELGLSAEQVREIDSSTEPIDVDALLSKGLKAGRARVKYVFDTPMVIGESAKLISGTRVPFVTSAAVDKKGDVRTSVRYEEVGCIIDLKCAWADPERGRITASWDVEISELVPDSPIGMAGGTTNAPIFATVKQRFNTLARVGEPITLSALSIHRLGEEQTPSAIAYVYHACFEPSASESGQSPAAGSAEATPRPPRGSSRK